MQTCAAPHSGHPETQAELNRTLAYILYCDGLCHVVQAVVLQFAEQHMQKELEFYFWADNASMAICMLVIKGTSDPAVLYWRVCKGIVCFVRDIPFLQLT